MSERISYYDDYISPAFYAYLRRELKPVAEIPGLSEVGESGGLESKDAFKFLCELYEQMKDPLAKVLKQRILDSSINERARVTK
jgi:hypothetical protein